MNGAPAWAVAFDLDGTLLDLHPAFVDRYLDLFEHWVGARLAGAQGAAAIRAAAVESLRRSVEAPSSHLTLADRFYAHFEAATGFRRSSVEPLLHRFHGLVATRLAPLGRPVPGALGLLATLHARGIRLGLVTNPVFPREAIRARLGWAGLAAVPFAWISCLEEAHAAKPNPALYREAARRLGVAPERCLMVGDDWGNDIEPARTAGMATVWVGVPPAAGPGPARLAAVLRWVAGRVGA